MRGLRLLCAVFLLSSVVSAQAGEITVRYVPPKNPAHEPIFISLKQHQALEKLEEIFSPFKLPQNIELRTIGCEGQVNAWYHQGVVSVCYEYLAQAIDRVMAHPGSLQAGISPRDAMIGQFFYVFAHEFGHAAFESFSVPVFGGLEDAADHFAAYIMLQFNKEDARRLIHGAAFTYQGALTPGNSDTGDLLKMFSDIHGAPAQRLYNLLCMAYGADRETFEGLVQQGFLPKQRAAGCRREYGELRYAFQTLVKPHVDENVAKQVLQREWLPRDDGALPVEAARKPIQ